jgi:hypothetical protein
MKAALGLRGAAGFLAAAAFGAAFAGAAAFFAAGFAAGLAAAFFAGAAAGVFLAVAIFEPPKQTQWEIAQLIARLILVGFYCCCKSFSIFFVRKLTKNAVMSPPGRLPGEFG